MCEDIFKQSFVFLHAGTEYDGTVRFEELVRNSSEKFFGSEKYVNHPKPLRAMFRGSVNHGELEVSSSNYIATTKFGRESMDFYMRNYLLECEDFTKDHYVSNKQPSVA